VRGLRATGAPPARAVHAHADGARGLSGVRPQVHRHAGHARSRPTSRCTRPTSWCASARASTTA
jgi:hypothetical protein